MSVWAIETTNSGVVDSCEACEDADEVQSGSEQEQEPVASVWWAPYAFGRGLLTLQDGPPVWLRGPVATDAGGRGFAVTPASTGTTLTGRGVPGLRGRGTPGSRGSSTSLQVPVHLCGRVWSGIS